MITVSVKHFSGFEDPPQSAPTVLAGCLITPTSMTLDEKTDTLYITELATGRVVSVPIVEQSQRLYISKTVRRGIRTALSCPRRMQCWRPPF